MFTKEQILQNKALRGLIKLRIERGEIKEAYRFIRVCLDGFDLREIDEVFQIIKKDLTS